MVRSPLARARCTLGVTKRQLGELLGLDPAAVHRLETGERRPRGLVATVVQLLVVAVTRHGVAAWGAPGLDLPARLVHIGTMAQTHKPQCKGVPCYCSDEVP